MHLVFISSLLTLSHTSPYPSSPAPYWPSSTDYILKSNETYNPTGCSKVQVLRITHEILTIFRRGIVQNVARNSPKNFVTSPLAVSLAMFLVVSGREIPPDGTKLSDEDCFGMMGMQPLFDYLTDYGSAGLSMATGVFVSPKLSLRLEFIDVVTKMFRTPLRRVDFENSTQRAEFISYWGADHIKDFVNANTSLALINVINFEAEWAHQFDVNKTVMRESVEDGNTTVTSFMLLTARIRHGHHVKGNADFFELPFKSDNGARNMSMFIIKPKEKPYVDGDVPQVYENIEHFNISDLMSYGTYGSVSIFLQKFKLESVIDIKMAAQETLGKSGEYDFFDSKTPKLTQITESPNLFGDNFVQRIFIEVDENGCQAVSSDTVDDPAPQVLASWQTVPYYVLIGTTDDTPQVIFAGRYYGL